MRETELVEAIRVAASDRGHRLFVNHQGTARYKRGERTFSVTYGVGGAGAPDLIGWTRDGAFAAIEVKVPGKRPKPHQGQWMAAALASCEGIRVGWADSVERAMEVLE